MMRSFVAAAAVALAAPVALVLIRLRILGAKVLLTWFLAPVLVAVIIIVIRQGALAILLSTASFLIGIDLDF